MKKKTIELLLNHMNFLKKVLFCLFYSCWFLGYRYEKQKKKTMPMNSLWIVFHLHFIIASGINNYPVFTLSFQQSTYNSDPPMMKSIYAFEQFFFQSLQHFFSNPDILLQSKTAQRAFLLIFGFNGYVWSRWLYF